MSQMLKERRAYAALTEHALDVLEERAAQEGLTRSAYIRRTLLRELGLPVEPARVNRRGDGK